MVKGFVEYPHQHTTPLPPAPRGQILMSFGELLTKVRKTAKITIYRLARDARTDWTYVRRLETGERRRPSRRMVLELGQALLDNSGAVTLLTRPPEPSRDTLGTQAAYFEYRKTLPCTCHAPVLHLSCTCLFKLRQFGEAKRTPESYRTYLECSCEPSTKMPVCALRT